jgi:thioredoxin 1
MKSLLALIIACATIVDAPLYGQGKKAAEQPRKPKITFIELGSVKCIPCRQMQPVMKAVEEKYSGQVQVVFYDVWREDQRVYAEKYHIRLIPTQIFLDQEGRELMRHEGFFPEKEIDTFLQSKGLKPKAAVKG